MKNNMDDDKLFNPFYIGPHPSKACAVPEIPPRQCSPDCTAPKVAGPSAVGSGSAGKGVGGQGTAGNGSLGAAAPASNSINLATPCAPYPCYDRSK
ncbi:uncharacterized protein LOC135427457 [Drosophila montana]|uniref:uncharacterized protein LOC135427457 n=1 Tax=Drosophila montana TaxID=40370 RepID=UPI00313EF8C3